MISRCGYWVALVMYFSFFRSCKNYVSYYLILYLNLESLSKITMICITYQYYNTTWCRSNKKECFSVKKMYVKKTFFPIERTSDSSVPLKFKIHFAILPYFIKDLKS